MKFEIRAAVGDMLVQLVLPVDRYRKLPADADPAGAQGFQRQPQEDSCG